MNRRWILGGQVHRLLSPGAGLQEITLTKVAHAQIVESERHIPRPFFCSIAEFLDEIRNGFLEFSGREGSLPAGVAVGGAGAGWNWRPLRNRLCAQQGYDASTA